MPRRTVRPGGHGAARSVHARPRRLGRRAALACGSHVVPPPFRFPVDQWCQLFHPTHAAFVGRHVNPGRAAPVPRRADPASRVRSGCLPDEIECDRRKN
ncbi:putative protein without homology [Propionibacterium freudenreichii subsp. shermanii]|nr:putative protein without homology [Propionibacterium freudenreichii subsp. shermanii]